MASNDAITKTDIESLKVYIDGRIAGIESRIAGVEQAVGEVKTELYINAVKLETVKHNVNWNFAILALVVAIVGFTITLAPMFREIFRDKRREKREDEMRRLIREELAKLQGNQ